MNRSNNKAFFQTSFTPFVRNNPLYLYSTLNAKFSKFFFAEINKSCSIYLYCFVLFHNTGRSYRIFQGDLYSLFLAPSHIGNIYLIARTASPDLFLQLSYCINSYAIYFNDDVPTFNSRFLGSTILAYSFYINSFQCFKTFFFRQVGINIPDANTQQSSLNYAIVFQIVYHFFYQRDWHSKRVSRISTSWGSYGRIYPYQFTFQVHKCTTTITRVYGSICLDKGFYLHAFALTV